MIDYHDEDLGHIRLTTEPGVDVGQVTKLAVILDALVGANKQVLADTGLPVARLAMIVLTEDGIGGGVSEPNDPQGTADLLLHHITALVESNGGDVSIQWGTKPAADDEGAGDES